MAAANAHLAPEADHASPVDPRLKPLLDHIASELAHEYVRLMEAAAAAEIPDPNATEFEDPQP